VTRELIVNDSLILIILCMKCSLNEHGFLFLLFRLFMIYFHDFQGFLFLIFSEITSIELFFMPNIIEIIKYDVIVSQRRKGFVIFSQKSMGISIVFPRITISYIFSTIYYFMNKTIAIITINKEITLIPNCVIPS